MGTIKQKLVARELKETIETGVPKTGGEILENIGYSKAIQKNPKMILESEGVREELKKIGINVEEVDSVVRTILLGAEKDTDKLKAGDMIYKRLGSYANESKMADAMLGLSQMFDLSNSNEKDNNSNLPEVPEVPNFIC